MQLSLFDDQPKSAGRLAFSPSSDNRRQVAFLAGLGTRQSDIATLLGVCTKTLRKHFRSELTKSSIEANAQVLDSLFKMALSGKHPSAAIFWAKTRCGFRMTPPSKPPAVKKLRTLPSPVQLPPPAGIIVFNNDGAPRADF